MSDHVYKTVERTGTSEDSIEDAANTAIRKASKTIRNLRWFEVTQHVFQSQNELLARCAEAADKVS